MKNFKIVFAALFLTVGAIVFSSFISKGYDSNAFARRCFLFNTSISLTTADVNNNATGARDAFCNTNNWTEIIPAPNGKPSQCVNTNKVCAICFASGSYSSLADALSALCNALPNITLVDAGVYVSNSITFYEKQ